MSPLLAGGASGKKEKKRERKGGPYPHERASWLSCQPLPACVAGEKKKKKSQPQISEALSPLLTASVKET